LLASLTEKPITGMMPVNIVAANIGEMMKQIMMLARIEHADLTSMLTFVLKLSWTTEVSEFRRETKHYHMILTQVTGPITFEKFNVFTEQALVEVESQFSGDSFGHGIKVESP
jgi:hypothetical protein